MIVNYQQKTAKPLQFIDKIKQIASETSLCNLIHGNGVHMGFQTIFKRYEIKYLINEKQKSDILNAIKPYMSIDGYGRTVIRNLYFYTDSYRLIRTSIEKTTYKEKLRIRSYGQATSESTVFAELKKKYKSVVYKRRISLQEQEAVSWLCNGEACQKRSQISDEIDYFMKFYDYPTPKVFLSYEREAYYLTLGGDFRVTFD